VPQRSESANDGSSDGGPGSSDKYTAANRFTNSIHAGNCPVHIYRLPPTATDRRLVVLGLSLCAGGVVCERTVVSARRDVVRPPRRPSASLAFGTLRVGRSWPPQPGGGTLPSDAMELGQSTILGLAIVGDDGGVPEADFHKVGPSAPSRPARARAGMAHACTSTYAVGRGSRQGVEE
jgi:hypothetical protein